MNKPLTIKVNGIGSVLIERSRRAKQISISVKAFRGVRVAVPLRTSFNDAIEFVHLKKRWIQNHLAKIKLHETQSREMADLSATIDSESARRQLIGRLNRLAMNHRFAFTKVFIRNQKTRWGSCSHNNTISLNMKLVLLPKDLIDYVILHELVHTKIANHGNSFWNELDRHVGNSKAMASRLRKYDLGLS
jgi:predicted metal-dependent hydrolase